MKRHVTILLSAIGLFLLCAVPGSAQGDEEAIDGILDLSEIQANPEAFKTTTIVFRGQFHRLNQIYNPFYTVFDSATFLNFSAWEFDAPLWEKESFKCDFPLLYVDKREYALSEIIQNMPVFTRFEATGVIKSTFDNKPWIMVTSFKEIPSKLNKKTIGHMVRGYNYRKKNDPLNAVLEFSQAYAETLPLDVKVLLRKEEGKSLFAMEYYSESVTALTEAQALMEDTRDAEVEGLLKEAIALADYQEEIGRLALSEEMASEPSPLPETEEVSEMEGDALEEDDWEAEEPGVKEEEVPESDAAQEEPAQGDGNEEPKTPESIIKSAVEDVPSTSAH